MATDVVGDVSKEQTFEQGPKSWKSQSGEDTGQGAGGGCREHVLQAEVRVDAGAPK